MRVITLEEFEQKTSTDEAQENNKEESSDPDKKVNEKAKEFKTPEDSDTNEYKKDLKRGYSLLLMGLVFTIFDNIVSFLNSMQRISKAKGGTFSQTCCFLEIPGLIAIASILGGIYFIYISKEYFVKEQKRNIEVAGKIFIILVFLVFVSLIITTVLMEPIQNYESKSAAFGSLKSIFYISPILSLLMGILTSLVYIYLIKELVSKKVEYTMWTGLIVRSTGPMAAFIFVYLNVTNMAFTKTSILTNLEMFIYLMNISVIGTLLLLAGPIALNWNKEERLKQMKYENKKI
ncbi:MAG: hypothetical protein ACLFVB_00550 [Thermoplasmata archaeon]